MDYLLEKKKSPSKEMETPNDLFFVACVAFLSSHYQVLTELGHPFDRQTLFAVSVHYKDFLYGYEQVGGEVAVGR